MPPQPPPHPLAQPAVMQLAEAAIVRLCHDFAGAVGALAGALQLADAPGPLGAEALLLAREAAEAHAARLRLARLAWGCDRPLDCAELPGLAAGLPNQARLRFECHALAPGTLAPQAARLLLAGLCLAAESLHGPGRIALHGDPARTLRIVIAGPRAAWPAALPALLAAPQTAWTALSPATLSLHALALQSRWAGARLALLPPQPPDAPGGLEIDLSPIF